MNLNHHNCIAYRRYLSPEDSLGKKINSLALVKFRKFNYFTFFLWNRTVLWYNNILTNMQMYAYQGGTLIAHISLS